jgi:hypothetical protein
VKETTHCCDRMREELLRHCELGVRRSECPDALIAYSPKFNEYGIIVHDGGLSFVQIHHCPWCGTKLPESERDGWFDALERNGIDPTGDLQTNTRRTSGGVGVPA